MNAWCDSETVTALESTLARALASAAATVWLGGSSVATAFCAASLTGGTIGAATGAPTGLMLKSVLMAPPSAIALACSSQIPSPLGPQLYGAPINSELENALNAALTRGRKFYEKCSYWRTIRAND